jgi:hypothetical protein
MAGILLNVLGMMRLRSGPQDLPASRGLMLLLALAYILQGPIAGAVLNEPDAAPRTLLAIALQFVVILSLLKLKNFAQRAQQTISALSATGVLFSLISILVLSQMGVDEARPDMALLYLALFVWSLLVDAHIYRHALSIKMSAGVLVAVSIFAANLILLQAIFG